MKKLILIAAVLASACALTSCEGINAAKEDEQIEKGQLYLIGEATVVYDNGLTYAFKDKGAKQYVREKGSQQYTLYIGKQKYDIDDEKKEYSEGGGYNIMTDFVVTEYVNGLDANYAKSKENIAGVNCIVFTPKYDMSEPALASYKRIRMNESGYSGSGPAAWHNIKAVEFKSSADDALFTLPQDKGYKDKWHTFD